IALVEVAEHHHPLAELGLRGTDPTVQLRLARLAVLTGDLALPRGIRGDRVVHGGAGTVAVRDAVDVPGRGEQGGGAGAPAGGSGGDVADGQVDRGGRGHGVLLHQGAGSCAGAVDHRPVRGPLSARWMDSSWRYRRAGRWRPPVRNSSVATSRPEPSIWRRKFAGSRVRCSTASWTPRSSARVKDSPRKAAAMREYSTLLRRRHRAYSTMRAWSKASSGCSSATNHLTLTVATEASASSGRTSAQYTTETVRSAALGARSRPPKA